MYYLFLIVYYFKTTQYSLIELAELEVKHAKNQYEFLRQSLISLQELA